MSAILAVDDNEKENILKEKKAGQLGTEAATFNKSAKSDVRG